MIRLQSSEEFDKVVEFEYESFEKKFFSKKDNTKKGLEKTSGFYSIVEKNFLALFKFDNKLYFRANEIYLEVDSKVNAKLERKGNKKFFSIFKGIDLKFRLKYVPKAIYPPLESDLVSFLVKDEDFDFCLFLNNVIGCTKRRKLFLEHN